MILRWIGAGCVFLACAGTGFQAADALRREQQLLSQTKRLLEKMECELSCRASSLPQLCLVASGCGKTLEEIYKSLASKLQAQILPDAMSCMESVLSNYPHLPGSVLRLHRMLGQTLGKYDLAGQLEEIGAVKDACNQELSRHRDQSEQKIRSYQTLGLCAGAGLAILLI